MANSYTHRFKIKCAEKEVIGELSFNGTGKTTISIETFTCSVKTLEKILSLLKVVTIMHKDLGEIDEIEISKL